LRGVGRKRFLGLGHRYSYGCGNVNTADFHGRLFGGRATGKQLRSKEKAGNDM
jgi:hypothetical protein